MESYFTSLVARGEKEIYIAIKKNGTLIWQGEVLTDLISIEHASYPYQLELSAVDGLGTLSGIEFDPSGLPSVTNGAALLANIFSNLYPSGSAPFSNGGILFSTSFIITHENIHSGDIFNQTGFQKQQFKLEQKEATDGRTYMYYSEVLQNVLRSFGARICYSEGQWRIKQVVQEKYYTSTIEYNYDETGAEVSHSTYDCSLDYANTNKWSADPIEEFRPPVKKWILPAKSDTNLIGNGGGTGAGLVYEASPTKFLPIYTSPMTIPIIYYDFTSVMQGVFDGGSGKKGNISMDLELFPDGSGNYRGWKANQFYVKLMIKGVSNQWYSLTNWDNTTSSYFNANTQGTNTARWQTTGDPTTATHYTYGMYLNWLYNNGKIHINIPTPDFPEDIKDICFLVGWSPITTSIIAFSGYIVNGNALITSCTELATIKKLKSQFGTVNILTSSGLAAGTVINSFSGGGMYISNTFTGSTGQKTFYAYAPDTMMTSGDTDIIQITQARLDYVTEDSLFGDKGVVYTVESNLTSSWIEEDEVYNIVDFTGGNSGQCVKIYDNTNAWVDADSWKILPAYATESYHALIYNLASWKMRFHRKSLHTMSGAIQAGEYYPHLVLEYRSKAYIFIGGSFDGSSEIWQGEWAVIDQSSISDITIGTPVKNNRLDNIKIVTDPFIHYKVQEYDFLNGVKASGDSTLFGMIVQANSNTQDVYNSLAAVTYTITGTASNVARANDINLCFESGVVQFYDGYTWQTGMQLQLKSLADGQIWIGNSSNVAQARTLTGDVTVSNTGVTAIGTAKVVDAMLATSYIKADGTRALTANWAAGNFSITANGVIIGDASNSVAGGSLSGGNVTVKSTTNATKGQVRFGNTNNYYDEANNRWIVGDGSTPIATLDYNIAKASTGSTSIGLTVTNVDSGTGTARGNASVQVGESSTNRGVLLWMGVNQTANSYSGNSSISKARVLRIQNVASANNGNDIHILINGGSTSDASAGILGITKGGSDSSSYCFRHDSNGLAIDTLANIHNANTHRFWVNGSVALVRSAKTGNYTLTNNDFLIDVTSGTNTQTLPTAASIAGRIYYIFNSGSGTVTVATTSSQTINGSSTVTITQYQGVGVMSNGTNWIKIFNI